MAQPILKELTANSPLRPLQSILKTYRMIQRISVSSAIFREWLCKKISVAEKNVVDWQRNNRKPACYKNL